MSIADRTPGPRPGLHSPSPSPLRVVPAAGGPASVPAGRPDPELAAAAVADLLVALGRDVTSPHLADTPRRVADAYLPGDRILGLSKLARVLGYFARDLQVQERLTTDVADWLQAQLSPRGVGVVIEAEHLCMSLRGVQVGGSRTTTSALHGALRDDPRTRAEFLALCGLSA